MQRQVSSALAQAGAALLATRTGAAAAALGGAPATASRAALAACSAQRDAGFASVSQERTRWEWMQSQVWGPGAVGLAALRPRGAQGRRPRGRPEQQRCVPALGP
jgi:hypothetical protein